jgi:hypothetical protein
MSPGPLTSSTRSGLSFQHGLGRSFNYGHRGAGFYRIYADALAVSALVPRGRDERLPNGPLEFCCSKFQFGQRGKTPHTPQ